MAHSVLLIFQIKLYSIMQILYFVSNDAPELYIWTM